MMWRSQLAVFLAFLTLLTSLPLAFFQQAVCYNVWYPNCSAKSFKAVPTFRITNVNRNSTILSLSDNFIKKIHVDAFSTAGNSTTKLDLSHNYISEVVEGAFQSLTATLEILLLNNNELTGVVPHYFINLIKLKYLDLSANHLTSIDGSLVGLNSLSHLILDDNDLQHLPDYIIRSNRNCERCSSTLLSPTFLLSLKANLLRYIPSCPIEKLTLANPLTEVQVSLSDNFLFCDCRDARWAGEHLVWGNNASEGTVCAHNSQSDVMFMKPSDMLSASQGCAKVNHTEMRCNSLQLHIVPFPAALTPTLRFGVSADASAIAYYNITLVASNNLMRMSESVHAGINEFTLHEKLSPHADYTICVEATPINSMAHEIYFAKICRSHIIEGKAGKLNTIPGFSVGKTQLLITTLLIALLALGAAIMYARGSCERPPSVPKIVQVLRNVSTHKSLTSEDMRRRTSRRLRMSALSNAGVLRSTSNLSPNRLQSDTTGKWSTSGRSLQAQS